ncbi:hypothetical protein J8L88_08915 [Aquimarina sp. MMG015]|uniref:hypothetical protein n=1 Tax=Aquimarina TaxID=290174 RepID=UPI0003F6C6CB|nr:MULTISPECIES: hypothetical protein [Aquimarina]AXT58145.1 hypothetical protein D1815_21155 [Aquimarina sp. AD1]MBQ4802965.1 hypothetical protein [Aquimarina sp. MMG015]RKN04298.1 hypothetical protein D7035_21865 [Aquimarina sp. AD1]
MNKIETYIILLILGFLTSCSSSELIEVWKNPDIESFEANKVLVIGMTSDLDGRKVFEKKLTAALKKNGVKSEKSLDFFQKSFTDSPKTEEDLITMEGKLLEAGFDAILLSKVLAVEDRLTVVQAYRNMDKDFRNFKDDYYKNQDIYYEEDYYEEYEIYHAETSLYCICPDKERELIWKGSIDITEPENVKKAVSDYVKVLIWALKGQKLLIIEEEITNENIDL